MFGHQNDVITQDQKSDASVPLPEETIDALTSAPATSSETDSPAPTASAPAMNAVAQDAPEPVAVTVTPTVVTPTHAMDGFIAPSAQIAAATTFSTYAPAPASATPTAAQDPAPEPAAPTQLVPDESPLVAPPATPEAETPATPASAAVPVPIQPTDLLKIKQEALLSLSPLVGKLDINPEEKFRTLMMFIHASDDHNFLTQAYETAQTIQDEKARAQALLDVVNEINYFTNQSS